MSKMNSVVHFEMPYDDRERMAKFYQMAARRSQAPSMAASFRKGPTGRRNILPSSSRSMTSGPR
jgi:hypothetical protein